MIATHIRIRDLYDSFSEVEKKVADYFLLHSDEVFNKPIAQLAESVGVNPVAWVRFAKKLGFDGLKSLKKTLFTELSQANNGLDDNMNMVFSDIRGSVNVSEIVQTVKESTTQAISDTANVIDLETLGDVAKLVAASHAIHLFGYGASALVAADLQSKLMRIGITANYSQDLHMQLVYAANASAADVAIFISNSGNTSEIIELLDLVKSRNCPTIAITKLGKNPLATKSDYQLYTSAPEVYVRSGAMSSRIAQLILVDILFTVIASQNYVSIEQKLEQSHRACRNHRISKSSIDHGTAQIT